MEKFRSLGLSENVLAALQKKGWENPSAIQEKTIPLLLADVKDVVGQAQTGTGKTGAFGLPLIDKLDDTNRKVQALVLCPTRELAIQVAEEISSFKGDKKIWVQAIYGGQSYTIQERALHKGVQIVVGTPGRVRDHIEKGTLKLDSVTHVVLDEADEMLNMGFEEEVREILKSVPKERRMLLFSATMPAQILKLAKTFMGEYELIEVEKAQVTNNMVDQMYFEVRDHDRFEALCRIIDTEPEFYGIVFCRTKNETDIVSDKLIDRGYDSEGIHGDVTQSQRELILKKFKLRKVNILVATDVAARGIDVNDLTHVVNYNLPQDPEAYVHRIGRTGRAGKHGTAITIVSPKEKRDLLFIQKIAKSTIRKEEVPSIADVIETKKMKLKTEIADLVEKGGLEEYVAISMELLEDGKPAAEVMAALLAYSLKDNLKELSYREVGAVAGGNHAATPNGQTRLFIAKGHMDRMNAENVAQYIADECNIDVNTVQDIRVFDKFSFVTVPNNEGETILAILGKSRNGRKPLVTRAKEKDSAGGGGGGNRNGGGGNWGKPKFGGERKSFGGNREGGERGNREGGERTERSNREGGERKSFGERKGSFGDKRKEGGEKKFDKKPFEKRETVSNAEVSDRPVRKRENKMTDYLETSKPAKTEKPSKKKEGSSDLNDFMKKFDDDLSW